MMKKFENPEMNISLFDAEVVTVDSALTQAQQSLAGIDSVDTAVWDEVGDWDFTI
jgi:hypothetical protein